MQTQTAERLGLNWLLTAWQCQHPALCLCLVLAGKDTELDAVGRQFQPYPCRSMRLHAGGALVV